MTFFSRLRWAGSILLVFMIVLMTNLIDRDNFKKLSDSVTTIYEDRIIASDILFEVSWMIQKQEVAVLTEDSSFFDSGEVKSFQNMNTLLDRYANTDMTPTEKKVFTSLRSEVSALSKLELKKDRVQQDAYLGYLKNIKKDLHDLSRIQLEESRRQHSISSRAKETINLFTQVEIIFLVLMAVFIQILIFYKSS